MQGRYLYERGNYASASPLLHVAEDYCRANPENTETILADIYGAFGSRDSESNNPQSCLENFEKQLRYTLEAFDKDLLQRPNVREPIAYGGLANAHISLNKYEEAEKYYRTCLQVWRNCPGDSSIYVAHLGSCLNLQGKLEDSEQIIMETIRAREAMFGVRDTTSFRYVIFLMCIEILV